MNVCVEMLVRCAHAEFEMGIDALLIGEGGAGAKMLSPSMYESQLEGVHKRMIDAIQGPTIMHICGDITPRLDALSRIGLTCFNFDWAIEPRVMKRVSAGKFTIMGNLSTTDLLRAAPMVIEEQVFDCLEAGVDIIAPGCAVSPQCPSANFQAMAGAIRKWADGR
jgi:[methyl-Co(III) methanol-specific corrinoid protein]:coenzyme M methyltransferase